MDTTPQQVLKEASEQAVMLMKEREGRGGHHADDARIPSEISSTIFRLAKARKMMEDAAEASRDRADACDEAATEMSRVLNDLRVEWEIAALLRTPSTSLVKPTR